MVIGLYANEEVTGVPYIRGQTCFVEHDAHMWGGCFFAFEHTSSESYWKATPILYHTLPLEDVSHLSGSCQLGVNQLSVICQLPVNRPLSLVYAGGGQPFRLAQAVAKAAQGVDVLRRVFIHRQLLSQTPDTTHHLVRRPPIRMLPHVFQQFLRRHGPWAVNNR